MINFTQKFKQTEQKKKTVNSIMLMKNDKIQQQSKYELILNKLIITKIVLLNKC